MFDIGVKGWRTVTRALHKLNPKAKREIFRRFKRQMIPVVARSRDLVNVLDGDLHDTIRSGVNQNGVYLRAGSKTHPYAAVEEFGQRHPVFPNPELLPSEWTWAPSPKNPFVYPAVREFETEFKDAVRDAVRKTAAQLGFNPKAFQ